METAVCELPGKIGFRSMPVPEVSEGNVLVKLEGCGVCGSNLPLWEGRSWFKYPLEPGAPGHEGWGRVERVGCNVRGVKEGDRVAVLSSHAFARYDLVAADSLVLLPSELDNMPFPGEPLGCAMNIINRCDIREGQTVAVVGAGFIGALLISLAAKRKTTVMALSRRRSSLDVALSSGASAVIPLNDDKEVIEAVGRVTGGRFCDRVIEATGYQWPLDIAGKVVNEGGKLIIAGYHQDGLRSVNMQSWNWKGIDVINAHERKTSRYVEGMRDAVGAILAGELEPSRLYTHVFPLEQLSSAFEVLRTRPEGFVKALVTL